MQQQPVMIDPRWKNPRGYYPMGNADQGFYDQSIPLLEDPSRDYQKSIEQNRANRSNILDGPVPERIQHAPDLTVEDIGSIEAIKSRQKTRLLEPIYRVVRIIANSKYSNNSATQTTKMAWNLGPFLSAQSSGTIMTNDELLGHIVAIRIQPFDVPTSLFTTSDSFFGVVGLTIDSIKSPEVSIAEYVGPPNTSTVNRYHYSLKLSPSTQANRTTCTPVQNMFRFLRPTNVSASLWELSFMSQFRNNIPIPPSIFNTTVTAGSNPAVFTTNFQHNLQAGDQTTIETADLALTPGYTPSQTIFNITIINPTQFSIPLSAAAIVGTTYAQLCIVTRVIRTEFEIFALDLDADLETSTRALMTWE